MRIYADNGYLDIGSVVENSRTPFIMWFGGRGPGKTYGGLKYCFEHGLPFIYLRRKQKQAQTAATPDFAPFKKLDEDMGWNHTTEKIRNTDIYRIIDEECNTCGYIASLATFVDCRGFSAESVQVIIYDEFIPELHERKMSHEAEALDSLYETVNRNRELEGKKPCMLWLFGNSNTIDNPIMIGWKLVSAARSMCEKGLDYMYVKPKYLLISTQNSPISARKAETAFYAGEDGYNYDMAIGSKFQRTSNSRVGSRKLTEYIPVVAVGELCIYKHKSSEDLYCSEHRTGSPPYFGATDIELKRFWSACPWVWRSYMRNTIIFESEFCEVLLTKYLE